MGPKKETIYKKKKTEGGLTNEATTWIYIMQYDATEFFFPLHLLCLTMKEYKMHPENWENYEAHLKKTNIYVHYFFYIFSCWPESESILNTHAHVE